MYFSNQYLIFIPVCEKSFFRSISSHHFSVKLDTEMEVVIENLFKKYFLVYSLRLDVR